MPGPMTTTRPQSQQGQSLTKPVGNDLAGFGVFLKEHLPQISAVCAKHMTPERLTKIVFNCVSRTPALRACSMQSIYRSLLQAAELGLEPGSALGEAYLVPYKDTCQLIPGYRGLTTLARRSGEVELVQAFAVYEGDLFTVSQGTEQRIEHVPSFEADRADPAKILFVYAVAVLKGTNTRQFDVMTRTEIERIRNRSAAGRSGPWVSDWAEMAKKTVVRRLCKSLPMSTEMAKAQALDDAADTGQTTTPPDFTVIDVDPETGDVLDQDKPTSSGRGVEAVKAKVVGQPIDTNTDGKDKAGTDGTPFGDEAKEPQDKLL